MARVPVRPGRYPQLAGVDPATAAAIRGAYDAAYGSQRQMAALAELNRRLRTQVSSLTEETRRLRDELDTLTALVPPSELVTGTSGQVLGSNGTQFVPSAGLTNPMTTKGDIIFENATPAPDRLAIGTPGQVLTVASGLPAWAAAGGGGVAPFNGMLAPTVVAPTGWTWGNQGSASATANAGGALVCVDNVAFHNIRHLYFAIPASGDWTYTLGFVMGGWRAFIEAGLGLRESGTGKIYWFMYQISNALTSFQLDRWSNYTTFVTSDYSQNTGTISPISWLQVFWNSATSKYTWRAAIDGGTFQDIVTTDATTSFTSKADQVGLMFSTGSTSSPQAVLWLHSVGPA